MTELAEDGWRSYLHSGKADALRARANAARAQSEPMTLSRVRLQADAGGAGP